MIFTTFVVVTFFGGLFVFGCSKAFTEHTPTAEERLRELREKQILQSIDETDRICAEIRKNTPYKPRR